MGRNTSASKEQNVVRVDVHFPLQATSAVVWQQRLQRSDTLDKLPLAAFAGIKNLV
jgi:hypothetical protein